MVKGSSISSLYPRIDVGNENKNDVPISAITNAHCSASNKTQNYNAPHFNREEYASRYSTPFTPDPSLMKPVNMGEWTPSLTTPLVTPFGRYQSDPVTAVDSRDPSVTDLNQEQRDKEMLRPSAKVFIPTDTPLLKGNPQPQRGMLRASMHAPSSLPRDRQERQRTPVQTGLSVDSLARAHAVSGTSAPFEVPKAMTPLAAPSAALPARPTACAVAPNLPRWAQPPAHAMMSSFEPQSKPAESFSIVEPSIIRRASSPNTDRDGQSKPNGITITTRNRSDSNATDVTTSELGLMSAVDKIPNSGSMTPWARRRNAVEIEFKGHPEDAEIMSGKASFNSVKYSVMQVATPSAKTPSSAVQVSSMNNVKATNSFNGNSWRSQVKEPRKPSLTPSIPGGLLGAVPMHSVNIKSTH